MVPFVHMNNTDQSLEDFADLTDVVASHAEERDPHVYELGYHLVPTLTEDVLEKEAETIAQFFTAVGGELVGARAPRSVTLAYPIDKEIDGKRHSFSQAYFGWMAYAVSPSQMDELKEALDTYPHFLRFILVKTTHDQVATILADTNLDVGAPDEESTGEEIETVGADTDDEVDEGSSDSEEKEIA
jgi:ribosomal protein S6